MSLELADFIKDLVATNPLGSDPKSQGDDHLRLIKEVLKNQFPGFTDGVGISKTESQLNAMLAPDQGGFGGTLDAALAANIDAVPPVSRLYGVAPAALGTKPPLTGTGDVLLVLAYSPTAIFQIYMVQPVNIGMFIRKSDGVAWSTWRPVWYPEPRLSYAFGSGYSNASGAGIRKLNGVVHLEGVIQRSSPVSNGQTIATLPVGMRPQFETGVTIMTQYSNLATQLVNVQIQTNGVMQTSYVVTTGGTPSGNCSFWLHAAFVAADVVT